MGTNYVSMEHLGSRETNLSREHSFGEEGRQFIGEALVLKRTSCSIGNFTAKFLNVVFKWEELVNRNCTGTRGKMALDPGKMGIIKKYLFKFYPCAQHRRSQPRGNVWWLLMSFYGGKSGMGGRSVKVN